MQKSPYFSIVWARVTHANMRQVRPPVYLFWLFSAAAAWATLTAAFVWAIDPYGVSPVRITWEGVNALKPKRLDIDRLIKPYEVWRYQPRTVFLGTSRIHQAI